MNFEKISKALTGLQKYICQVEVNTVLKGSTELNTSLPMTHYYMNNCRIIDVGQKLLISRINTLKGVKKPYVEATLDEAYIDKSQITFINVDGFNINLKIEKENFYVDIFIQKKAI